MYFYTCSKPRVAGKYVGAPRLPLRHLQVVRHRRGMEEERRGARWDAHFLGRIYRTVPGPAAGGGGVRAAAGLAGGGSPRPSLICCCEVYD